MNIRDPQQRRSDVRKVWTEHDDELIELMAGLFESPGEARGDAHEIDRRPATAWIDAVPA